MPGRMGRPSGSDASLDGGVSSTTTLGGDEAEDCSSDAGEETEEEEGSISFDLGAAAVELGTGVVCTCASRSLYFDASATDQWVGISWIVIERIAAAVDTLEANSESLRKMSESPQ